MPEEHLSQGRVTAWARDWKETKPLATLIQLGRSVAGPLGPCENRAVVRVVGALVAPLASVAPAGNPGPTSTCSYDLGAEIGEGLLEAGTPKTQLLQPGEVQGVAQTCVR